MSPKARKWLFVSAGLLIMWFAAIVAFWAIQPLEDTIPTGLDADGRRASVTVECNRLFESNARNDVPLPELPAPQVYEREACELVHGDAQLLFVIDTVVLLAGLTVLTMVFVRLRRQDLPADDLLALAAA